MLTAEQKILRKVLVGAFEETKKECWAYVSGIHGRERNAAISAEYRIKSTLRLIHLDTNVADVPLEFLVEPSVCKALKERNISTVHGFAAVSLEDIRGIFATKSEKVGWELEFLHKNINHQAALFPAWQQMVGPTIFA